MKKYCARIVFVLAFFLPSAVMAQQQDITGMWYGEIVIVDSEIVHFPYEIAITEEKGGKLAGYSRIVFHANGKDEAGVQNISVKWKGDEIIMEDEGFIVHGFSVNTTKRVKKTLIVKLAVKDTIMELEGTWSTNRTRIYRPYKGTALLKRKYDFKKTELFKSLDTLKLVEKLSFKDQPQTAPVMVAAVAPVVKKPDPVVVPVPEPDAVPVPEPELSIPGIEKAAIALAILEKRTQPSATILPATNQKKTQLDAVTKTVIKPAPAPPPPAPVVAAKPEPVVAAAPPPKPEKKAPVAAPPKPAPVAPPKAAPVVVVAAPPVKKPAPVVAKPVEKPAPPPVAIIAPSVTQGAAELEKRTTKADQSLYFESDSLSLTLYDNGEVDGDVVTVVMNGNIIFSKTPLTTIANTKTIYTRDIAGDSVSLIMYAESLGEIPPNTGLMIIMDGEKRYEVRFSADLKTNAGIILRRRKDNK